MNFIFLIVLGEHRSGSAMRGRPTRSWTPWRTTTTLAPTMPLRATVSRAHILFATTVAVDADRHCEPAAPKLRSQRVFDWLEQALRTLTSSRRGA
jgi:hypothetical protein